MDREKLKEFANDAIEKYFGDIDSVIDNIVSKMADDNGIEDDDDINYLKIKIKRGILKWDE